MSIDVDSLLMELRLPLDKLVKLIDQLKLYLRKRKATRLELEGLGGSWPTEDLLEANL